MSTYWHLITELQQAKNPRGGRANQEFHRIQITIAVSSVLRVLFWRQMKQPGFDRGCCHWLWLNDEPTLSEKSMDLEHCGLAELVNGGSSWGILVCSIDARKPTCTRGTAKLVNITSNIFNKYMIYKTMVAISTSSSVRFSHTPTSDRKATLQG